MNSRKIDIHKNPFVLRVVFEFLQRKINLFFSTIGCRASKSRQPITFSKVTGKHTPQFITLAEEVHPSYTNRFITYIGKALHKSRFRKRITSRRRNTSRTSLHREKQPLTAA